LSGRGAGDDRGGTGKRYFSLDFMYQLVVGSLTIGSIQALDSSDSFASDLSSRSSSLICRNGSAKIVLVYSNLVVDGFLGLCGGNLVCGVGCSSDICLLNREATSKGSCDGVVSAADGADVSG
jgi:hypothetical protein